MSIFFSCARYYSRHKLKRKLDRTPQFSYLSNLRHWKWMDDSNKSTPVLSGSCLQSCMQCLSAASKSPAWYSRWANSANPWKESIRFVGSGESPKHLRGENKKLDNGNETKETKQKQNKCEEKKKKCFKLKDEDVWNYIKHYSKWQFELSALQAPTYCYGISNSVRTSAWLHQLVSGNTNIHSYYKTEINHIPWTWRTFEDIPDVLLRFITVAVQATEQWISLPSPQICKSSAL